jgi:hypothetical protein
MFYKVFFCFLIIVNIISCSSEDYEIIGTWRVDTIQCDSYSFYETTIIFFQDDDSLGRVGYVIPHYQDTIPFTYKYTSDKLTLIGDLENDWISEHQIISLSNRKLSFELKTDSCRRIYRFIK